MSPRNPKNTHPYPMFRRGFLKASLVALALVSVAGASVAADNTSGVPYPPTPTYKTGDAVAYGTQLAHYADDLDRGWVDQYSKSTMTLIDGKGDKVTREVRQMTLEGKNGDKAISRFMSPPDIRGVAALIHEHTGGTDDSWLYLPSSRRVRRISGANRTSSFQGTEFTYEDLSGFNADRYKWKHLKEASLTVDGKANTVHELEAVPTYKDTGYSRLVVSMNKAEYRIERIQYFDKAGRHLKTLDFTKWHKFHGRYWRAQHLNMQNHQTQKRTVLQIKTLLLNLSLYKKKDGSPRENLTDAAFTKRALEKG